MVEGRKRKTVFEIYEKKRKASEVRNKTRVFLGDSFTRWRALKLQAGLPTDASVAKFLLDSGVRGEWDGMRPLELTCT
uniref:Uncharacterized protein n=1 Tax=Salarias fasciatus TaxID=181472 RepID=A0A672GZL4_SALFA